ncbi:MAG: hypothetical protein ABI273_14810 [Lacunisphaera sp.]
MKTRPQMFHRIPMGLWFVSLISSSAQARPLVFNLPLAQIPPSLKNSIQFALGIVFLFGFIWGVVKIWTGADRLSKGDADGKMGIVAGIIIAGAAAIMGALFTIFGMGDGVLTPTF